MVPSTFLEVEKVCLSTSAGRGCLGLAQRAANLPEADRSLTEGLEERVGRDAGGGGPAELVSEGRGFGVSSCCEIACSSSFTLHALANGFSQKERDEDGS